jgi:hypothetical membrane protein
MIQEPEWIKNINNKKVRIFDKIYRKIPGEFFGILGSLLFALTIIISYVLYNLKNPSFNIFTNWVSDLGAGPNGASLVFNSGIVIVGIIIIFFHFSIIHNMKNHCINKRILKAMTIGAILISSSLIFVGFFPINRGIIHNFGAYTYFSGSLLFYFSYSIAVFKSSSISRKRAITSFITIGAYCLFFLIPSITPELSKIGLTITFLEWMTFIAEFTAILEIATFSVITRKRTQSILEKKQNEILQACINERFNKKLLYLSS